MSKINADLTSSKTIMTKRKKIINSERIRLKTEYGELFEAIAKTLFHYDPIHINFQANTDEYEPEASTILPRLHNCQSVEDITSVVHEEFIIWFSPALAGSRKNYNKVANEIWDLWIAYKKNDLSSHQT